MCFWSALIWLELTSDSLVEKMYNTALRKCTIYVREHEWRGWKQKLCRPSTIGKAADKGGSLESGIHKRFRHLLGQHYMND